MQIQKLQLTKYASKLPYNTSKKLLKKLSKENSYVNTLKAAFKTALEINRETSFVNASMAQQEENKGTSVDTQINELDDSFQDMDINYMNTRSKTVRTLTDPLTACSAMHQNQVHKTPLEATDQTSGRTTFRDTTTTATMNSSTGTISIDMTITRTDTTTGSQSASASTTTISQDNK